MKSRVEIEERISRLEDYIKRSRFMFDHGSDEWMDYWFNQICEFENHVSLLKWVLEDSND